MKTKLLLAAALLSSIALGAAADGVASNKKEISAAEIQSNVAGITGFLGKPLGTYSIIEGMLEDRTKAPITMVVDTLDGKKLARPIPVGLHGTSEKAGTRVALRGFETMTAYGTPHDPRLPEDRITADQGNSVGHFGYEFWFQVTSVEKAALEKEGQ